MKQYSKSLDFVTLALASGRKGNMAMAAKLFAKAIAAPDSRYALHVLEASNKQAFQKMEAARIAAAKKAVRASDEEEDDMGSDEDMEDLVGGGEDEEGETEEVMSGLDEEGEDEEEEFDHDAFAATLTAMTKGSNKAKRK